MKIGIATLVCSSVGTAPDTNMLTALEMLAEAGYDCAEYSNQSIPQFFTAREEELLEVKKKAETVNVRLHSAHSPLGDYDLTSLDDEDYEKALEVHLHSVEALALVGVEYFVVHQVGGPKEEWPRRAERAVPALEALCQRASEVDIRILIENLKATNCEQLRELIEKVGSPVLGICLDIGHANCYSQSVVSEIEVAAEYLWSIHAHDNHGPASGDEHLPPGWGTVNWQEVVHSLNKVGYGGPFMMEVIRANPAVARRSPAETLRISFDQAKKILAKE